MLKGYVNKSFNKSKGKYLSKTILSWIKYINSSVV